MTKLLAIVSLCLAVSMVASQSCTNTSALRTKYGFGNTITTAATQTGVNYCNSIKSSAVCCTAADLNTIQAKTDALTTNLTTQVSARDKYFASGKSNAIANLQTAISNYAKAATSLTATLATTTDPTKLAALAALSSGFSVDSSQIATLTTEFGKLTQDYTGFQKARVTCVNALAQLQAAAWCASCDPNIGTKGWDQTTNTFSLGDSTCTTLRTACYDYLNLAQYPNAVISIKATTDLVNAMTKVINTVSSGGTLDATALVSAASSFEIADLPASCTATKCDFICQGLFETSGMIDIEDLVAGGDTEGSGSLRRLEGRQLSGSFSPAADEAGVKVTFAQDPASTDKAASLSLGSVFAGMMMMISCVFLF